MEELLQCVFVMLDWDIEMHMVLVLSGVHYSNVRTQHTPVEGLKMDATGILSMETCTETQ